MSLSRWLLRFGTRQSQRLGQGGAGTRRVVPRCEQFEERIVPSAFWQGYARDPEHTGLSAVGSQPLAAIHWQTPVDLNPQYSGSDLLIHYGSPAITANNTVIVPVKTGASGGFTLEGLNGT